MREAFTAGLAEGHLEHDLITPVDLLNLVKAAAREVAAANGALVEGAL